MDIITFPTPVFADLQPVELPVGKYKKLYMLK